MPRTLRRAAEIGPGVLRQPLAISWAWRPTLRARPRYDLPTTATPVGVDTLPAYVSVSSPGTDPIDGCAPPGQPAPIADRSRVMP
jgi:hypothetical protein